MSWLGGDVILLDDDGRGPMRTHATLVSASLLLVVFLIAALVS